MAVSAVAADRCQCDPLSLPLMVCALFCASWQLTNARDVLVDEEQRRKYDDRTFR